MAETHSPAVIPHFAETDQMVDPDMTLLELTELGVEFLGRILGQSKG